MSDIPFYCIKTGADVYLTQYGIFTRGDLYRHGDLYVLRTVPGGEYTTTHRYQTIHAVVHDIREWWDRSTSSRNDPKFGTMIALDVTFYGHTGKPWNAAEFE